MDQPFWIGPPVRNIAFLLGGIGVLGGGAGLVLRELGVHSGFLRFGHRLADGVRVFRDADGGGEYELLKVARILQRVRDGHVSAQAVAQEREALDLALYPPFLERVDEPRLALGDLTLTVFGVDPEGRPAAAAHA